MHERLWLPVVFLMCKMCPLTHCVKQCVKGISVIYHFLSALFKKAYSYKLMKLSSF